MLIATLDSGTVGHVPPWTSLEAGMYRTNINSANKTPMTVSTGLQKVNIISETLSSFLTFENITY